MAFEWVNENPQLKEFGEILLAIVAALVIAVPMMFLKHKHALKQAQGKLDEAEPLIRRDLAISEKALGPDHPDVAITLNNLALLLKVRGSTT